MNLETPNFIGNNKITIKLKEPYFTYVSNGIKTIDCRINDENIQEIKEGDIIKFISNDTDKIVYKSISSLKIFNINKTFSDVITKYNYNLLIPNAKTVEDAIKVYTDIPGYLDKANKYGILFICLRNPLLF